MTLPKAVRQLVGNRAGNCCEYCCLPAAAGAVPFHVDHINPVKHGGLDDTDNLCLACYKCKAHKGHDLVGFDPQTGELTRLYHPREQRGEEHFTIQADMRIQGLTSQGRSTVRVLQMNDEDRLENRQLLTEIGEYPCL